MGRPSIAFDPIADRYDETRGGLVRGGSFARTLAAVLGPGPGPIVEVGVGTGLVASPLAAATGRTVLGVDLSLPMLTHAAERIGARVACGDGQALPVADRAAGDVVLVWLLHLTGDAAATCAEARRVLAPGGRLAVIPAGAYGSGGDVDLDRIEATIGEACDRPDPEGHRALAVTAAEVAGLALIEERRTATQVFDQSPAALAERYEERTFSWLWAMSDADFAARVQPGIDGLRALREPGRPRRRAHAHDVLVFAAPTDDQRPG